MLENLLKVQEGVSSGIVTKNLLNGQYRVLYNGRPTIAISQAGLLSVGQAVTIASTAAGLVVISAGNKTSSTATAVTING